MRKIKQFLLISLLIFGSFSSVWACECFIRSHRKVFKNSKNVFIGKVTNIDSASSLPMEVKAFGAETSEQVEFEIEKSWKGKQKKKIKIWTFSNESACGGFRFSKDKKYLVYTFKENGVIYTPTFCSRTRLFKNEGENKDEEIKELNSFWFRFWARINPF